MENNLDIIITQGASWEDAKFYRPEDLSLGTAKGQIRTDYLSNGGKLIAEFEFYPLTYGSVLWPGSATSVDRTIIIPKLSAEITAAIPVGRRYWVYDIFVGLGLKSYLIAGGKVVVNRRVTEG
jgi:hypothetical protein